jgi:adenine phosphoribosyltransferase
MVGEGAAEADRGDAKHRLVTRTSPRFELTDSCPFRATDPKHSCANSRPDNDRGSDSCQSARILPLNQTLNRQSREMSEYWRSRRSRAREWSTVDFSDTFVERFRWIGGHADVLGLFADGAFLAEAAEALAAPFRVSGVTKVAGVEARGFILGTAVALDLAVGFVPIRKRGSIHPGPKASVRAAPDWRGNAPELLLQRAVLSPADRVLVVDDWVETASQALAARRLIEECGGQWGGLSVLVNQADPATLQLLEPVSAVVAFEALPASLG